MVDFDATHNFITELEARRLRLRWENDSRENEGREFRCSTYHQTSEIENDEVGRMERPSKCLMITGSFPTIVRVDICQPNEFKTISGMQLHKNPTREEPTFVAILLEMIDHEIELLLEAKASAKNAYRMTPPELAKLRQRNWVQLLNVDQFGHNAQTDSLTRRSQFEIDGSRHSVLSPLVDLHYVGNNPQVHRFAKEWEEMADIARACLEKASR
ncbi:reverse transcriptase [Cucumis melo var. makuwa]|uniref:Reverse transcriptase n=1 Tax=Cucumis melo var. makuwa TaxID=1194695 RepID=A0A5D3DJP7_CUCMM|nr:reverse transcriptase [Cucumis melo var. makuwa]